VVITTLFKIKYEYWIAKIQKFTQPHCLTHPPPLPLSMQILYPFEKGLKVRLNTMVGCIYGKNFSNLQLLVFTSYCKIVYSTTNECVYIDGFPNLGHICIQYIFQSCVCMGGEIVVYNCNFRTKQITYRCSVKIVQSLMTEITGFFKN